MSSLVGYAFTTAAGETIEVTGRSPVAGYVEVRVTAPDGTVTETLRVADQIQARRDGEERRA